MRLSKTEKEALNYALNSVRDKVYLFGSRVLDDKKGGDIDIVIFSKESSYLTSKQIAVKFFSRCESKIDVLVLDPDNLSLEQKAFINEQKLVEIK